LTRVRVQVRLLLDRGAVLNAADSHADTPLTKAAELGHANVCSILLRQGAALNHRRRDGSTALLSAVRAGRNNVVQVRDGGAGCTGLCAVDECPDGACVPEGC
jgi:ankyrin repeat protein